MQFCWSLTLYQMVKGFRVIIKGDGRTVVGNGRTAQEAHRAAECKLVVKPWVCAEREEEQSKTCKYTQADGETTLYLTDCGREFWRESTRELYDFCHWCGGAVEEVTPEKAPGLRAATPMVDNGPEDEV